MSVMHVVSVSGGKDSTATLLLALERVPRENIRPIFCDTGNEHEETYEYLRYLELALDVEITRLRADFSDRMAVHRQRLLDIAAGGADYHPQAKYAWTPERAARAAELMHPTGNPFLDLAMLKGMFPSHSRQFCTEALKRDPAVEFQLQFVDAGHRVVSWQGVRRDESARRANVAQFERIGPRLYAYRPIAAWTANQVFDYSASKSIMPNPLYLQGMDRVGCMPCVNVGKSELREIARRFPEHIERIAQWESLVNEVSRSQRASFLFSGGWEPIHQRVEWARTTRGGAQFDLLADIEEPTACASSYGLCA
ncbi:phosphoadenosine phosphosulfate reductase family protein [Chromobacterium subtsugae]|uniref:Phosphoadenosine phosphosulfate reductase family protein n=1 Tax=Chromobacterium subtsugae TaxID=251747 RepID=A0ABS7FHV6_9NEIS|nr:MULTISPECIES: phosphoadenosine phosphosulfate reductase family protein [Chromobacterium]KUM02732.1 phosphoadenosine phosphosulfate reductase [Chromobacterium subtsugae]KZE84951.1 phosphoadenosine phosphosulfate reductase [Chromobacterium sp. F49]MBW7567833.1 phosphoadenosine phosphosulfate reductase family protein [Chromobacterium subtsugae]MBW8289060.1 phosphoadenosine phosphosulfate reductase family protein [Chromobacterium subtsugae]WSE93795.1 phosphoadenosine phosphosulfate reductase fa